MATDDETLERMARAGCIGMKFGLESADPEVLRRIGKPVRPERVRQVAATARRLGIKTHMTVTFGLSGDSYESVERTFAFACAIDVDSVQFSVATPYPGTRFYEELRAADRLRYTSWEDFDGANNAVFVGDGLDRDFLERFEASAHGRWLRHKLRDPRWVLRQLRQLARLGAGQGLAGLARRMARAWHLLLQPAAVPRGAAGVALAPRTTAPRH